MGEEAEDDEEECDLNDPVHDDVQNLAKAVDGLVINERIDTLPNLPLPSEESLHWAGFNGRCNKYADTCYSFWNTATLVVSVVGELSPGVC
jgi:geranylgeranyl transferase type-1 subunit beta